MTAPQCPLTDEEVAALAAELGMTSGTVANIARLYAHFHERNPLMKPITAHWATPESIRAVRESLLPPEKSDRGGHGRAE